MSTPKWQGGHLYLPGDLVQPAQAKPATSTVITNAGFEDGDATGWTLGADTVVGTTKKYQGTYGLHFSQADGVTETEHDAVDVSPGKSITATCMYQQGAASSGKNIGKVYLRWYNASDTVLSTSYGSAISSSSGGWKQSTVTAVAPANAAKVAIGVWVDRTSPEISYADNFAWNYVTSAAPAGLIFKAVQDGPGTSAATEPVWPTVNGETVVDGTVTWEAVLASRVTWEASPILKSGTTEPEWPTDVGAFVADGTISWECTGRHVEDENCPNTKVVVIMAGKVFAVDGDIVRFSATANPLDWTTERDAGYLPTGLQSANANDMAVLAQYRGNLVAFNASSFQNWQADPDPEAMALLDQMEGIGSSWYKAAQPVANDLLFLSQRGVRSVGIAVGADNLAAGDVGEPVDALVQAAVAFIGAGGKAIGTYYPGAGQYWLAFPVTAASETWVYVYTMSGRKGKWSRYYFPFAIECFTQLGDDLYIRHGDFVSVVDPTSDTDEVDGEAVDFTGTVWWPWLDFGSPGVTKMLEGIDYIGSGQGPSIQVGYDQRNVATMTPAYQLDNDTLPGGIIPLPVSGPTLSVKLTFAGGAAWTVNAVNLQLFDNGNGP